MSLSPKQEVIILSTINMIGTGALVALGRPQYALALGGILGSATVAISLHGAGQSWGAAIAAGLASLQQQPGLTASGAMPSVPATQNVTVPAGAATVVPK